MFSNDFVPPPDGMVELKLVTSELNGMIDDVVLIASVSEDDGELVLNDAFLDAPAGADFSLSIGGENFLGIEIDIKPSSDPNSINLNSAGVVTVAILSVDDFDATDVDPETVELSGARVRLVGNGKKSLCHENDVDENGLPDLVCQVETDQFMVEPGADVAILKAQTFDGQSIIGRDDIRIVQD